MAPHLVPDIQLPGNLGLPRAAPGPFDLTPRIPAPTSRMTSTAPEFFDGGMHPMSDRQRLQQLIRFAVRWTRDAWAEMGGPLGGETAPRSRFVEHCFSSRDSYRSYCREFRESRAPEVWSEAEDVYQELTGKSTLSSVGLELGRDYYALVREHEPAGIVETGVCNGLSSFCLLLALEENDAGKLHSVDYPYYFDESLEEFRDETFDDYGGAAIPPEKEPGWVIPDDLRNRWDLRIGKSQRELPKMVQEIDSFELFFHDSEHSAPCMMFEFELAWEWMGADGIIVSDDIRWNWAFPTFVDVRKGAAGTITEDVGFVRK